MALLIALLYIGMMIYFANQEDTQQQRQPFLSAMHYGLLLLVIVWLINAIIFIAIPPEQVNDPTLANQIEQVDTATAMMFAVLATVTGGLLLLMTRSIKPFQWLSHWLPPSYNPNSSVHRLAVVLALLQSLAIVWTLMVSGGLEGLDFNYESSYNALAEVAIGAIIYLIVALLGVGWLTRRTLSDIMMRLHLRLPTSKDWRNGIGVAIGLYVFVLITTNIWIAFTPTDIVEQQTIASRQLFEAFNDSLLFGLLLALSTGISEEVLFRGALQPIFGLIPSSVFFTILHIQYSLTPATVILFIVSLGFGWARQHTSTTASIIAHSLYNFIPFVIFAISANIGIPT